MLNDAYIELSVAQRAEIIGVFITNSRSIHRAYINLFMFNWAEEQTQHNFKHNYRHAQKTFFFVFQIDFQWVYSQPYLFLEFLSDYDPPEKNEKKGERTNCTASCLKRAKNILLLLLFPASDANKMKIDKVVFSCDVYFVLHFPSYLLNIQLLKILYVKNVIIDLNKHSSFAFHKLR